MKDSQPLCGHSKPVAKLHPATGLCSLALIRMVQASGGPSRDRRVSWTILGNVSICAWPHSADPTGQICPLSLSLWSPYPSPLPPPGWEATQEVTRQLLGDTDPTCPDLLIPCFPPPHTLQTGGENRGCPRMGGWRGLMAAGHLRPPPERATDSLPRAGLPIPAGTEPTSLPQRGALQAKDVSALINELAI